MEPAATELTVSQILSGINQVAPLINGIWAVLSVILAAVIIGAVWVTKISIAVKYNTNKLTESSDNINPAMCALHREGCDRAHVIEYGSIKQSLEKIEKTVDKLYDRYERRQDSLV
jgi:hypothetical protein